MAQNLKFYINGIYNETGDTYFDGPYDMKQLSHETMKIANFPEIKLTDITVEEDSPFGKDEAGNCTHEWQMFTSDEDMCKHCRMIAFPGEGPIVGNQHE